MSTFTTIKTTIRDAATMHQVLQSIPGATIKRDVLVPVKGGGQEICDFVVELSDVGNTPTFLSSLLGRGLRYFTIFRDSDGTLTVEIEQEQEGAKSIESRVNAVIDQHQKQHAAEELRRAQQRDDERRRIEQAVSEERQRMKRLVEEERRRTTQEKEQTRPEAGPEGDKQKVTDSTNQVEQERARSEAMLILSRFDKRPTTAATHPTDTAPTLDAKVQADLNHILAQQYAREKVMQQVVQLEQQFGVRFADEERFQDGTIEITLRG